jgi:Uncharacterized conserved protein
MSDFQRWDDAGHGLDADTRVKPKRPPMYKVLMLNDDYTPMEFVVHVLERFFRQRARGRGFADHRTYPSSRCRRMRVFTYEIAETKMTQVMDLARENQHPLQCMMELA